MTELMKKTSSLFTNNSRNTIVLNGINNFSSLRIEDPKKANLENDVYIKIMMNNIPQLNQYFNIVDKLGEGTFSKVYKAKLKRGIQIDENSDKSEEYALKYIIPIVKPARVAKELRFLRDLGGHSNIIPIKTCFHNAGHTVIVMPIVEHDKFLDYLQILDIKEIRSYMRSLLTALDRVHAHGIIHRDIKPSNFLYNRSNGHCALVDFGLSQNERELYHSINLSLYPYPSKISRTTITNDSKVRKNLIRKFSTPNGTKIEESKLKRSFNDMNNNLENDSNETTKRVKFNEKESSVFISPITPSMNNNNDSKSLFIPSTPVKNLGRSPLAEQDNNVFNVAITQEIPDTPIKSNCLYKTPTKNDTPLENVNKTPVKTAITIPETPPKTVQKNLHFSRSTTPTINLNKENVHLYSTPKNISRPTFQRFQLAKKILHPELSMMQSSNTNSNRTSNEQHRSQHSCKCLNTANICHDCLSKHDLNVPRAGTPGFRAPEILLRCQNQSTKIDIWSCGVIFASLLSGRYPFFRCTDDMTCLAEIITVIGSSKVKRAAAALGKTLVISRKSVPAMNLKEICLKLKKSSISSTSSSSSSSLSLSSTLESVKSINNEFSSTWIQAPDSAYDLLEHLLDPNPFTRFSATEALSHPFFTEQKQ